ncbi:Hypothetical_protein [Hexamita inflata]|uniref:Hypothetical_protein n=1 Tax=Hexamita inflata TaxID=28002 RepID=A0AA86TSS9_9EUKA|nr:Hypothetical protein HINF_LOCUS14715 [Hexamita inflata]
MISYLLISCLRMTLLYLINPTHQTFVYTGSVSCFKPLSLQKNESMLDSPVPLFGFALQLLLGCSYWAGFILSVSRCLQCSRFYSEIQFFTRIFRSDLQI